MFEARTPRTPRDAKFSKVAHKLNNPRSMPRSKRGREGDGDAGQGRPMCALQLCAPSKVALRRTFELHFGSGALAAPAAGVQESGIPIATENGRESITRMLLVGPSHFPLHDIGAALVQHIRDVLVLRVHTASALPLAPHSALAGEEISYFVFVVDMADRMSFELFCEASGHVSERKLQRCGAVLVYGAEDTATHAFDRAELQRAAEQRAVLTLFLSAPRAGVGVTAAARAGAERLASLIRPDGESVATQPGQTMLRLRALLHMCSA